MKSLRSLQKFKPPTTVRALAKSDELAGEISLREQMLRLEFAALPRPFYLIAHRCNSVELAKSAIAAGANAIEFDVQFPPAGKDYEFAVDHDYAFTGTPIKNYLGGLRNLLHHNKQVALVIVDIKDDDVDRAVRLRQIIREHLTHDTPVNVIMSQAAYDSGKFFVPIKTGLKRREGYAIDQDNHPARVTDFFQKLGVANHCYGNGIFVAGGGEDVPPSIMKGIALKWSQRRIRWVYVWTLRAQSSMRNYLSMGVDGIMVNHEDIAHLRAILNEPAFKNRVRLATREENPFWPSLLPGYVLQVRTSSRTHAGTDANLTFELRGSAGSVSTTIDSSPTGLFESDGSNPVTLIGTDVGEIRELVITQDGAGNAPDWYVTQVAVEKSGSPGVVTTFDFTQWLRVRRPARRTPARVKYDLVVSTKDEGGAGTDADVKIVLQGTKGTIEKEFDGAGGTGNFEAGQNDPVAMYGIDIGTLKSITVSHDGSGTGDEWDLSRISVKGAGVNATVQFNCTVKEGKPVTRNA